MSHYPDTRARRCQHLAHLFEGIDDRFGTDIEYFWGVCRQAPKLPGRQVEDRLNPIALVLSAAQRIEMVESFWASDTSWGRHPSESLGHH